MLGSDISARVEATVTIAPRASRRLFRGASQEKRGGQIGVEHAMPLRERQSAERLADHNAGIGDNRVGRWKR